MNPGTLSLKSEENMVVAAEGSEMKEAKCVSHPSASSAENS